ncbi:MAG TPA: diphthine--ammonia ligase [Chitinophagaceae bacterium]|nr:diphthine--ammonia ligase [Chitinophagaceae bacterium]
MTRAYFNWSGGKDSALTLWKIVQEKKFRIEYLLTCINSFHNRISMHGVRRELLETQALALNIPLTTIELPEQPSMNEYETAMMQKISWFKRQGIKHSIFGDIFLEDLKKYREEKLAAAGIECVFPIWKKDTKELMKEFISAGFKAIIVCINEKFLEKSFCGRMIDESFCNDLPAAVDMCGENGEFHTFVYDGPIFNNPITFKKGEVVYKEYLAPKDTDGNAPVSGKNYGFYFCDLLPG